MKKIQLLKSKRQNIHRLKNIEEEHLLKWNKAKFLLQMENINEKDFISDI
jgi:hypothetical protein